MTDEIAAPAAWEARFRARRVGLPDWARDDDQRTVVTATTPAGALELHWWRVGAPEPVPATDRDEGTVAGAIDPTGEQLWWFDDRKGDERGTWQAQPFGSPPGSPIGTSIGPWNLVASTTSSRLPPPSALPTITSDSPCE
jgi:hypothetical protein